MTSTSVVRRGVRAAVGVCVLTALASVPAAAQSIPPVSLSPHIDSAKVVARHGLTAASPACPDVERWFAAHPWLLPLAAACRKAKDQDPNATAKDYILAFYDRAGSVTPADQVQFLYGFAGEQQKSLSADLVSLIFPAGVRVAVGSSVTTSSKSGQTLTPAQAVQQLRNGGDMYLTAAYPIVGASHGGFSASVWAAPRVNFLINGFGGADTITEATESTYNLGVVAFAAVDDLTGNGSVFATTRWGQQHVSSAFATSAQLSSRSFGVFEVALGVQFGAYLRVSFQRFQAPPAAAGVTLDQLSGWHLVVQLAPKASGG